VTTVEITGSVPRFSRRDVAAFARRVLAEFGRVTRGSRPRVGGRGRPPLLGNLSIAFVDDDAMRELNRRFRHRNKTTDVLTFSDDDADIVISLDQARRQAADEKHSLATEVRYLVLHGVLHALGYDHETDHGEMNALELRIRARVGLQ
jgi:probable rRNA maturation factor